MTEISFNIVHSNGNRKSRVKGKGRKYQSKYGWLSFSELMKRTGLSRTKLFSEMKLRSIDQILERINSA